MPRTRKIPELARAEGISKKDPSAIYDCIKAEIGRPDAPGTVSDCPLTLKIWNETLDFLESMGILTFADEHILCMYCTAYAESIKLAKTLQKEGHFYTDDKGNIRAHPASSAWTRTKGMYIKLANQLGLTPSARAGMPEFSSKDSETKDENDPKEFLGGFGL